MSRSSNQNQLFINDGKGNQLPVQTGTFVTPAINMNEKRRLSLTIGLSSSTGAMSSTGAGFTGILVVQGTDELMNAGVSTGTAWAGVPLQPGNNTYTGAVLWNPLPSGVINVTNGTQLISLVFPDVGPSFVRLAFNNAVSGGTATGGIATGTLGGSGTWNIFYTAKSF